MDSKIDAFNWELKHFLSRIAEFRKTVNQVNHSTCQLLSRNADAINDLVDGAELVETTKKNDPLWSTFDEEKFEYKPTIYCRICKKSLPVARPAYILHVASDQHNAELLKQNGENDCRSQSASIESSIKPISEKISIKGDRSIKNDEKVSLKSSHISLGVRDISDGVTESTEPSLVGPYGDQKVQSWLESTTTVAKTLDSDPDDEEEDKENSCEILEDEEAEETSTAVPNVFDKNIFSFIDSLQKRGPSSLNERKNSTDAVLSMKSGTTYFSNEDVSEEAWHHVPCRRQNDDQWRWRGEPNPTATTAPAKIGPPPPQGAATNNLISMGKFTKPCPAYEMNSLYTKYPHLNPAKVPNPLKPSNESITAIKTYAVKATSAKVIATNGEKRNNASLKSVGPNSQNGKKAENKPANTNQVKPIEGITIKSVFLKAFYEGDLTDVIGKAVFTSDEISQHEGHATVTASVMKLLKRKFNGMKYHLMGSRINGTTSDRSAPLDIYLDLHQSFHNDKSGAIFVAGMNDAHKIMVDSNEWSNVKCSEQTRYGILSATHNATNIDCCFTFGTGVFVRNNDLVKSFLDVQKICRPLILCIRLSMEKVNAPNWTKKFSGYIITLMVIFFFQTTKRLPSVLSLQKTISIEQCGENTVSFLRPSGVTICKERLSALLIDFFEYYAKFDFGKNIISPFEGAPVKHHILESNENNLSKTVLRFKRLMEKETMKWQKTNMCTQDIFMHKNNVTQMIYASDIKEFKEFCNESLKILRSGGSSVRY